MLRSFFRKRQCVPLVIPVEDEEKLQNIRNISPEELRPRFLLQLGALRQSLYAQLQPKNFRGTTATGASFADIIQKFVSAINNGGVPQVGSVWDEAVKSQGKKALVAGREAFEVALRSIRESLPLDKAELDARYSAACAIGTAEFDRISTTQSQITRGYRSKLVEELLSHRDKVAEVNETRSTESCTSLLNTLFRGMLNPELGTTMGAERAAVEGTGSVAATESSAKQMQDVWTKLEVLREKYLAESKGPSKLRVLNSVVASKMKDICNIMYDQAINSCSQLHDNLVTEKEKTSSLQCHVQELSAKHLQTQEALLESEGLLGQLRAEMSSTEIEAERKDHEMNQNVRRNEQLSNTVSELEDKLTQQALSLNKIQTERAEAQAKHHSSVNILQDKLEQALAVHQEHVQRATAIEVARKESAAASSAKEESLLQEHEALEALVEQSREDHSNTQSALDLYRARCRELQALVQTGLSEVRSSNTTNLQQMESFVASQQVCMNSAGEEIMGALTEQQDRFAQRKAVELRESRLLRGELVAAQESSERLREDAALQHGEHEARISKQVEELNLLQCAARAHTEQFEQLEASHERLQDSHTISVAAKDSALQRLAEVTEQKESVSATFKATRRAHEQQLLSVHDDLAILLDHNTKQSSKITKLKTKLHKANRHVSNTEAAMATAAVSHNQIIEREHAVLLDYQRQRQRMKSCVRGKV